MGRTKICLSLLNDKGALASLEDAGFDRLILVKHSNRRNPKALCGEASTKLRKLADAFDALAEMDNPFRERTHNQAMKVTSQQSTNTKGQ